MTAQTTETPDVRRPAGNEVYPAPIEIDRSCGKAVTFLLVASLKWLVISLVFGVLAAVKMHAPGMFANVAALTYGRVAAVASNAFLYGFASQAGIAIALWLFARLGRAYLVLPGGAIVAGLIWNLSVLLGLIGILAGGLRQYPAYEMPHWVGAALFVAFAVLGLSGLLTHIARKNRENFPSTWYLVAAFFVLPWILTTAYYLLGSFQISPAARAIIGYWYANNFMAMWLTPLALAALYYLIPKISNQPLYSFGLAATGFWLYIALAHAAGFQNVSGVPNWLPNLSRVINLLLVVPVLAIAATWYKTWVGHNKARKQKDPSSKYVIFSAVSFLVGALLVLLLSCPRVDVVVGLTLFVPGVAAFIGWAFIAMAFFAAIIHILPRILNTEWPSQKLITVHFALTAIGIVLCAIAMLLGGIVQGTAWNDASVAALDASRRAVPFIGINTIGTLVLLVGQVALLLNVLRLAKNCVANCCGCGAQTEAAR